MSDLLGFPIIEAPSMPPDEIIAVSGLAVRFDGLKEKDGKLYACWTWAWKDAVRVIGIAPPRRQEVERGRQS